MKIIADLQREGLDFLFPRSFKERVSINFYYRARVIAAVNLICSISTFIFFLLSVTFVKRGLPARFVWGGSTIYLVLNVLYIKNLKGNFENNIFKATIIQILFLTSLVIGLALLPTGLGLFGSITLIPVILMISFYFDRKISSFIFCGFFLVFLVFLKFEYPFLTAPIQRIANFNQVFVTIILINFLITFVIASVFSYLNEQLQSELSNHRELLIASAKFNSLGQMASTLAHDINNPLFTIQSRLHQIRNLLSRDQLDIERCDEIIEGTEKTIGKLSSIAKAISSYARSGRVEEMIVMSASELLRSDLDIAQDRLDKNGIDYSTELIEGDEIICHPAYLSQVILNLINNAIDALEDSIEKKIILRVENIEGQVHISVIDSGPGVKGDSVDQIFKPFYTTKKINKGTGLGLSISQGLVALHHGQLKYSRQNGLTSFIVSIPHADSLMLDE